MIYVEIFIAFFLPGILGYGGGPAPFRSYNMR